jgi:hypothetical protein
MISPWYVITEHSTRRDRSREPAVRIITTLMHSSGGSHRLRGSHGEKILTAIARAWNTERRTSPPPSPRVAADKLTPDARSNFHLNQS